jgi:hypothetical protein
MSTGLTLDTGALIALDRGDRQVALLLRRALERRIELVVPAGVVAQAWRSGRTQVRLARFLGSSRVQVEALEDGRARAAGQLCGATKTSDIVDASVVLCARNRAHTVVTSDAVDIRRLDAQLLTITV